MHVHKWTTLYVQDNDIMIPEYIICNGCGKEYGLEDFLDRINEQEKEINEY